MFHVKHRLNLRRDFVGVWGLWPPWLTGWLRATLFFRGPGCRVLLCCSCHDKPIVFCYLHYLFFSYFFRAFLVFFVFARYTSLTALLQCFYRLSIMATSSTSNIRALTKEERDLVITSLGLAQRSALRFSKSNANVVIASEFQRQADMASNLMNHFRNGSLDV